MLASVIQEHFHTCDQTGFCKRNKAYADLASENEKQWISPYKISSQSIQFSKGILTGTVLKSLDGSQNDVRFPVTISFLESGTARVTIDEEKRQKGEIVLRGEGKARKERYNGAADWVISGGLDADKEARLSEDTEEGSTKVIYGPNGGFEAIVKHDPFAMDFLRNSEVHISFNGKGWMNLEHWREKKEKADADDKDSEEKDSTGIEDESTWWDEKFGGTHDSKTRGPESIALDISFIGYDHVYGIPAHASSLSLKETGGGDGKYDEPYRLFNVDAFEYETDSPMSLYGAIPFMQAHRKGSTTGVFWLNTAETWIDIVKDKSVGRATNIQTHWISESGLLDVFVFLGPEPGDVAKNYGALTGFTQLPQSFAIGYHQCRWNYVTDEDVLDVTRKFDEHRIPFDVIWLDIEYTDGKKYFTWDPLTFPNPERMHKFLDERRRKVVTIIDPHIKDTNNYPVASELKKNDYAVRTNKGEPFTGHCWPGKSFWVDCFNPAARKWWASLFNYDKFKGTAPNTFVWNDMNEPAIFHGADRTMPKDALHYGNWEHRDIHNLNGLTFHNATYEGLVERKRGEHRRPFVLTRSFFAGSQRTAAMWTGDSQANWEHLAVAAPMLLSQGISGYPFAGADVGGFAGNPSKELLTRWYQAGAFYPFFRAHAHIDTRRREPYLAGDPYIGIITEVLRLRYSLLPAWYTAFHEASTIGAPIIRPSFYVDPEDEKGFAIDDQFYVGSTGLLVKPVVTEGQEKIDIYFANELYYDYFDFTTYDGKGYKSVDVPLSKTAVYMRGGYIIPRRDRPRRSSELMRFDPLTLVVAIGRDGNAAGSLYLDDGDTFDYEQGAFINRKFTFEGKANTLTSSNVAKATAKDNPKKRDSFLTMMKNVRVEKIILVGVPNAWRGKDAIQVTEVSPNGSKVKRVVEMSWYPATAGKAAYAIVRNPSVAIARDWFIDFAG